MFIVFTTKSQRIWLNYVVILETLACMFNCITLKVVCSFIGVDILIKLL